MRINRSQYFGKNVENIYWVEFQIARIPIHFFLHFVGGYFNRVDGSWKRCWRANCEARGWLYDGGPRCQPVSTSRTPCHDDDDDIGDLPGPTHALGNDISHGQSHARVIRALCKLTYIFIYIYPYDRLLSYSAPKRIKYFPNRAGDDVTVYRKIEERLQFSDFS